MKKKNFLCIAAVLAIAVMSCGSQPRGANPGSPDVQKVNTPSWLNDPVPRDEFYGIGHSLFKSSSVSMRSATTLARRDVAAQLRVFVQGMTEDWVNESGTLEDSVSMQAFEDVGRAMLNTELVGASPDKREQMADGTWWIRVTIKKADAANEVKKAVRSSQAANAAKQAALDKMDAQIEKYYSEPTVVEE